MIINNFEFRSKSDTFEFCSKSATYSTKTTKRDDLRARDRDVRLQPIENESANVLRPTARGAPPHAHGAYGMYGVVYRGISLVSGIGCRSSGKLCTTSDGGARPKS